MRVGVSSDNVKNVIIWGNHSSTQYPDVHHATVNLHGKEVPAYDVVKDDTWLKGDFISVSAAPNHNRVPSEAFKANVPAHSFWVFFPLLLPDSAAAWCGRDQSQEAVQCHVCCKGHL